MEVEQKNNSSQKNGNGKKAKHWCLTVNNYGDADICQFENIKESATYFIYGKEVGSSGTHHLQCYLAFKSQKTLAAVKKFWPTGHFEIANGTPEQASIYCKKDEDYIEWGVLPKAQNVRGGEATKVMWEEVKTHAKAGELDAINPKIYVTHYKTLKQIHYDHQKASANLPDVCGIWLWGEPGVGKSHKAREDYPGIYDKMCNKWWDGYNDEEAVLLDDFEKVHDVLGHHLKRWADKYPFRAEIKCHSKMLRPKVIVVTSNYHPRDIFNGKMLEAIERRFKVTEVIKLKKKDDLIMKKRKRTFSQSEKTDDKAPLYKQDKNGDIVPNNIPKKEPKLFDYLDHPLDICDYNASKIIKEDGKIGFKSIISIESDEAESDEDEDESGSIPEDEDYDTSESDSLDSNCNSF